VSLFETNDLLQVRLVDLVNVLKTGKDGLSLSTKLK
jgi:hypothetical protein